jgi:Zn-dependent oligopeptidase
MNKIIEVKYLNTDQMIEMCGGSYIESYGIRPIYGFCELKKSRSIFVLNSLSVWKKALALFHELGHVIFSYFRQCKWELNELDEFWDVKMRLFWDLLILEK